MKLIITFPIWHDVLYTSVLYWRVKLCTQTSRYRAPKEWATLWWHALLIIRYNLWHLDRECISCSIKESNDWKIVKNSQLSIRKQIGSIYAWLKIAKSRETPDLAWFLPMHNAHEPTGIWQNVKVRLVQCLQWTVIHSFTAWTPTLGLINCP